MLGKHFALLGSTGTGKSTSAALILHRICEAAPEGHIVMIDPHGEYSAAFRNTGQGSFEPIAAPVLDKALPRDSAAILGWRGSPGRGFLLASFSNYEDGRTTGGAVARLNLKLDKSMLPALDVKENVKSLFSLDYFSNMVKAARIR